MNKIFLLSLFIIITNTVSHSQGGGISMGTNYRIFPGTMSQSEVFITSHPTNSEVLFVSANTLKFSTGFFVSEGIYVTTNGGQSWYGSDTCNGPNIFFHGGDPAISITSNGTFILTRKASTSSSGAYSHYSTDNGITWSVQKQISDDFLERVAIVTDNDPSSSYFGRTYATWAMLTTPFPVKFTYTDDITGNWNNVIQVNNPTARGVGGDIALGPDNEVYICWGGTISSPPFTEIQVGFASSTNGGTNWSVLENAFSINGIQGLLASKQNIRVNGQPRMAVDVSQSQYRGTIYIVTSQKNLAPAGSDPDIILNKSTDGGLTWSEGIRVNQDQVSNGKYQFFPGITIDDAGGINIIFYDDRNTTSDSSGIFLARSTDGGNTWSEYEISDHNFRPNAIGGLGQGYMGDNIDIAAVGNKLYPVWMDNSTGIYQIWTVPIELKPVNVDEPALNLNEFTLEQNYPNPFNPSTKIKYSVPSDVKGEMSNVSLIVYDILGNVILKLVNERKTSGTYEVEFHSRDLPGGIYFYRLNVGSITQTKKMIYLK